MTSMIDKSSHVPLCHQLAELVRERIRSGGLVAGDQIPTEEELCKRYGISRTTVRQAISILVAEGLLVKARPKGTFVAGPAAQTAFFSMLGGSPAELFRESFYVRTEVVRAEEGKLMPGDLAAGLGIDPAARFYYLERIRYGKTDPILFVQNWVVAERCPGLLDTDFTENALYDTLTRRYGLTVDSARRTLKPVQASEQLAKLLKVPPSSPLLLVTSLDYTVDGRLLEYFECFLVPEQGTFSITVRRGSTAGASAGAGQAAATREGRGV